MKEIEKSKCVKEIEIEIILSSPLDLFLFVALNRLLDDVIDNSLSCYYTNVNKHVKVWENLIH